MIEIMPVFWCSLMAVAAADRPNIVFIMADDMGYGEVGCYGQKKIRTPNIDRLAEQGTRFTQFYAGSTVCAPTRSVLMTGQHTGHTWVRGNMSPSVGRVPLRPQDVTVAELLKKAGYTTGIVGKWGLGEPETTGIPNRKGFDFWFGYLNQQHAHSYYPDYLWKNQDRYEIPENRDGGRKVWSHDLMTREALGFIERSKDQPFFLYLAYTIPHAKYEIPSDEPYSQEPWSAVQKKYAAMITRMDHDIGRLMDLLKSLGIAEKTLVFFTSDNGPESGVGADPEFFDSNGSLRGKKRDLYEGGIRVPMIACWPGKVRAGAVSDAVWGMWDFLPTACELSGQQPPENIDGDSRLATLMGHKQKGREFLYWEFHESGFKQAVRMGDWKAVRTNLGKLELYDLNTDPGEQRDVADQHSEIVTRIEEYLKTARTESTYWPLTQEQKQPKPKREAKPKAGGL